MGLKENERIKNPWARIKRYFTKGYTVQERKDFLFVAALVIFPVIHVLVFYFYVNISSFVMAFQNAETGKFTFDNIRQVIEAFIANEDKWGAEVTSMLGKSVLMWTIARFISSPLGWVTCYFLTRHIPGSSFFRAMYAIPGLIGSVIMSTIWKDFMSYDGILTKALIDMGADFPIQVIRNGLLGHKSTAFPTLLTKNFIVGLAGGGLILAGAYMRIPNELFESASLDGCGFFRETFSIAIPCVWSTISTLMIFDFCGIFTNDSISAYIYSNGTGAYGINSMGFYLYTFSVRIASGAKMDVYHYLSAVGMVLTVMTLPLVYLGRFVLGKVNDTVEY